MIEKTITPAECAELIGRARRVAALTGAGVSTAAGIPDFRGPKGLYVTRQYNPETVFDIDYFKRNPEPFYNFTRDFLAVVDTLKPTLTHRFLARLGERENFLGLITQNIDPLHELAGSRNVVAVHGNYSSSHCLRCGGEITYAELLARLKTPGVPHCACGGLIKPDVVFFGEAVKGMELASELAEASDLFFVLGSSLAVYPAAGLPSLCRGTVVVVNQGQVSLGVPHRKSELPLDIFFGEVASELGLAV